MIKNVVLIASHVFHMKSPFNGIWLYQTVASHFRRECVTHCLFIKYLTKKQSIDVFVAIVNMAQIKKKKYPMLSFKYGHLSSFLPPYVGKPLHILLCSQLGDQVQV